MALIAAFRAVARHALKSEQVTICTDSQSNVRALLNPRLRDDLGAEVYTAAADALKSCAKLVVRYVPGHSGIAGNVVADHLAGYANRSDLQEEGEPITRKQFKTGARRYVRNEARRNLAERQRDEKTKSKTAQTLQETGGWGRDLVTDAGGRVGQTMYYALRFGLLAAQPSGEDLDCALCGQGKATTAHFVHECPITQSFFRSWDLGHMEECRDKPNQVARALVDANDALAPLAGPFPAIRHQWWSDGRGRSAVEE
ncbi:unnamed protein product [Amoebophrya sp. A120]|nr:unnamed protein product [Amoebophrya sp. A120]|eukprot:GSA120T00016053001.1